MSSEPGCGDCGKPFPGMHVHQLCGGCTGKRLAERYVRDVVEELLPPPEGHYERGSREYRHGSGRGLAVAIGGAKSGVWYDHSAGEGGDLLDLIAPCIGGDGRAALAWARHWMGQPERRRSVRPVLVQHAPRDETETREIAAQIWGESDPLSRDDPSCRYLAGRALDLERLAQANDGKLPATLRSHRALWNRETGRAYPAMVAAIVGPDGQFVGVHRTWLQQREDGGFEKASIKSPKMTLGHYRLDGGAGCIRLWRPKWREATEEDVLALSEGIEDGLTAALWHPGWRVAAGVSLSALLTTRIPPVISRVVLVIQNDKPGSPAVQLLGRVRERFRREGREVSLLRVPPEVKDLNELAMRFWRRR
jgi:hypothetical protein